MDEVTITSQEIEKMLRHWLNTPVNTYLGSSYGFDKNTLLFTPLSMNKADEMIAKLKHDIPLFSGVNVNMFSVPIPPDKLQIFIQVGDVTVEVN
ncbi:hypothetical protein [Gallibacterium sp. ZY190522]